VLIETLVLSGWDCSKLDLGVRVDARDDLGGEA
jgi:hypothetical protein